MKISKHARQRMCQRGISDRLMCLALQHGRPEAGDRLVLDRKEALRLLQQVDEERSALMKVIDKGGIVVVDSGNTVVTAYNITRKQRND